MPVIRDTLLDTLQIVRINLDNAIDDLSNTNDDYVVLSNIAFNEGNGKTPVMTDKVVITVIKTEEESAMKNQPAYRRDPVSGSLHYRNPPVHLNIYLLFSANYTDYLNSLTQLSRVIGYFQYKPVFEDTDPEITLPQGSPITHFKFNFSMVSLAIEQINHIWSILGGKHLPFVMYKMQLLEIEYVPDAPQEAPIIEILQVQEKIF